jgi:hypothetical protein
MLIPMTYHFSEKAVFNCNNTNQQQWSGTFWAKLGSIGGEHEKLYI